MIRKLKGVYYYYFICILIFPFFIFPTQSRAIEVENMEVPGKTSDAIKKETNETLFSTEAESSSVMHKEGTEISTSTNIGSIESETQPQSSTESETRPESSSDSLESQEQPEEKQQTEPTTASSEKPLSRQTRADGITWTVVSNADELRAELTKADPPTHIKLGGNGVFSLSTSVPVKSDVVIDGDGKTVSYPSDGLSSGIYADSSNIEVTLQNMTFGSSDYSVPMRNLYGVFPASDSEVVKLNIHNVNYYSNRGAQAFFINETGSEIHFSGENEFVLEGSGQEFAEASVFYFEKDSKTTVRHQTGSNDGFIWARRSNNKNVINLAENAVFDVESNHSFIYNDVRDGDITVGKNAKLLIKSVNAKGGYSQYPIRYDGGKWNISVAELGLLDLSYPNSIQLGDFSNINIGKDANACFEATKDNSVFDRSVGSNSTFVIDNANLVEFTASPSTTVNPIGFVGGNNKFSFAPFASAEGEIQGTEGYAIRTTPNLLNINSQKAAGTWSIAAGEITREAVTETAPFTSNEQNAMKNATTIQLVKIPEPKAQISTLKKQANYFDFTVQLSNYELFNNNFEQVNFRLFSKEVADPTDSDGLVAEKSTNKIDGEVAFDNLEQDTKYWLYAQIVCDPSGQSSNWFKDTVKTKAMINVEVPTYIAFQTDTDANVVQDREYAIKNNGTSPVKISIDSFKVKSNPENIPLLTGSQLGGSTEGLFLKLIGDNSQEIELADLENPNPRPVFGMINAGNSEKIGLQGKYQGTIEKVSQLNSQLTLLIEDGNPVEGGNP